MVAGISRVLSVCFAAVVLTATVGGAVPFEARSGPPLICEPAPDWLAQFERADSRRKEESELPKPAAANLRAHRDALADELFAPRFETKAAGTDTSLCLSWEMTATSDPNNPQRLAFIQGSTLGVSTDGGDSFTLVNVGASLPAGFTSGGDGSAAYDSQGRLFVAIIGNPVATPGLQIFASQHSPVTGALVGGPVNVSVAAGVTPSASSDKPWIAADANPASPWADSVYVVWSVTGGSLSGAFEIWGAYSSNQGTTWNPMTNTGAADTGPISPLNASDGFCWPPHVAVGLAGDVYVSYHGQPGFLPDPDGRGPPDGISGKVVVLRSTDGGFQFGQRSEAFPAGLADTTWNVQNNATGQIPDARFATIGTGAGYLLPDPDTACTLHVVATDDPDNDPTTGDAADVVMATSNDCGLTWSTRQTVSEGPPGSWQLLPAAAIDAATGAIAVTWLDNRNAAIYPAGSAGNARADLRARYSLDGGASWQASLIVNDVPIDPDASTSTQGSAPVTYRIGEYTGVTFAECAAHMFWPAQATCAPGAIDTYYDRDPAVSDVDAPEITCPPPADLGCNEPIEPAILGQATGRDDCDGNPLVTYADAHDGGTCSEGGTVLDSIERTWSVTDGAGNVESCVQLITITDFDAPLVSVPQPIEMACTALGGVPVSHPEIQSWLSEAEAQDACSAVTLETFNLPDPIPVGCNGEKTFVSFIATDSCGNSDSQGSTVTVYDGGGPALFAPVDATFECTAAGGTPNTDPEVAAWLASPETTDPCSVPVLTNAAPNLLPGSCDPGVTTLVLFKSTDDCGNESFVGGNATVVDTLGPDVVGPVVHEVLLPADHTYRCFDDVLASATLVDACDGRIVGATLTCTSSQCDDAPCAEHPGEEGDGTTTGDCTYDADLDKLCARAERADTDPLGRLYTVTVSASDSCGNENKEPILEIHVPLGCLEGDADCLFKDGFESGPVLVWTDTMG